MIRALTLAVSIAITPAAPPPAAFHLMQIEQVIGGVNGDPAAQAIQLRMRDPDENQLQFARILLWSAGAMDLPAILIDFDAPVPNGQTGDRVLIVTESFCDLLDPPIEADFVLAAPIPVPELAAGSLSFQDGGNSVYWRLSWGGAAYQGPTDGAIFNDPDGEFGPPFDGPLPAASTQTLRFGGPAEALSTSNLRDYAYTAAEPIWTNNAGASAVVVRPVPCLGDLDGSGQVDVADLVALILAWGSADRNADLDGDGIVGVQDLSTLILSWGPCL